MSDGLGLIGCTIAVILLAGIFYTHGDATAAKSVVEPMFDTKSINFDGGDGHQIKLKKNDNAVDPTYQQMVAFLQADTTDRWEYIPDKFVCADFAELLQNRASDAGIRCGWVYIMFDDGQKHACNAFNTTDSGLVFVDDTNSIEDHGPHCRDCTVEIVDGNSYNPKYIFPHEGWQNPTPMGIVQYHSIKWADSWI